jgi:hypothetical protein
MFFRTDAHGAPTFDLGLAAPQEPRLSVTRTSGAKPCFLSNLRISSTTAALSRHGCTSRSRTSPSSSTEGRTPNCPRNHHGHLVEMLHRRWPGASTAKLSTKQWREVQHPPSHRFVGHIEPTLSEQIFDVAMAERESHREPNGVPDDRGRKLVAGKRDRHPPSYPANRDTLPWP